MYMMSDEFVDKFVQVLEFLFNTLHRTPSIVKVIIAMALYP